MLNAEQIAKDRNLPVVTLNKHRATWYWFYTNTLGGGFGSNHCGAKAVALNRAISPLNAGDRYILLQGDKDCGVFTKQGH